MDTILRLLKLQIDNKTDLLKTASPLKMLVAALKLILGLAVATLILGYFLFSVVASGISISKGLLAFVLLVTQLISFVFAIGNIISTLYLSRDNELLICLPVSSNQLFISKIILIYLKEVFVNTLISVPLFIGLAFFGGFGLSFYLSLPLLLLILPIFPIVMAAFVSVPIMMIIRFLRRHSLLAIFTILGLVAVTMWGYISLIGGISGSFFFSGDKIALMQKMNASITNAGSKILLYFQMAGGLTAFSDWIWYLLFVGICAMLAVGAIFTVRPIYFKMAMSSLENKVSETAKPKKFKKESPFISLIKRETLCIFRSPTQIFEYFLFTLLMPFIVFSYDKLMMTTVENTLGKNMVGGAHIMVVTILAMLSNIVSASAISREGGNFHTSKTVPVNYYTQIFAKFAFNAFFTFCALMVTMGISFFIKTSDGAVAYPPLQLILGTAAVFLLSLGHIALSIDLDIKNPTPNLQGNEQASITSKSTPISICIGLLLGLIMGTYVILSASQSVTVTPYLILLGLTAAFAIWRLNTLVLRIQANYNKIEM